MSLWVIYIAPLARSSRGVDLSWLWLTQVSLVALIWAPVLGQEMCLFLSLPSAVVECTFNDKASLHPSSLSLHSVSTWGVQVFGSPQVLGAQQFPLCGAEAVPVWAVIVAVPSLFARVSSWMCLLRALPVPGMAVPLAAAAAALRDWQVSWLGE